MNLQRIPVWDWPVRLGHWAMAAGFIVAWLTAESESLRLVHVIAGGMVPAIALFRIVWGIVGTRHARFAAFVRGPEAVAEYLEGLMHREPAHFTGHNPAGGWAIIGLLALALLTGISGWALYNDFGADLFEELHEGLASTMLALVLVHVAGVAVSSYLHKENLARAMVTGSKLGAPEEAIASSRAWALPLLAAWVVAACIWLAR